MHNSHHGDGRRLLALSTQTIHEELHHHPLISRILKSDLTAAEYCACLNINYLCFKQIEQLRSVKCVFETFSLQQTVKLLESDLAHMKAHGAAEVLDPVMNLTDEWGESHILGALYVAYGSQFGRQVMAKAVALSLPHVPQTYLALKSDMAQWRELELLLDEVQFNQTAFAQVKTGAHEAFDLFKQTADHYAAHIYRAGTGVSPL